MGFLDSIKRMITDHPTQTKEVTILVDEEDQVIEEVEEQIEEIDIGLDEPEEDHPEPVDEVVAPKVQKMNRKEIFEMIWEDVTKGRCESCD